MADNADIEKGSWYLAGGACYRALHIEHILLVLYHSNMSNEAGGRLGEARS